MSTQKTIGYQPAVENIRIEALITREIKAPPHRIFPLACPVEELRWIPGWDYQLIFSKSGVNEPYCVFAEDQSGLHIFGNPVRTTWVTTLHDSDKNRITFHLSLADKAFIQLNINIRDVGKDLSSCSWHMIFTALNEQTNAMDNNLVREKLESIMTFLADALKHYCETGMMLA